MSNGTNIVSEFSGQELKTDYSAEHPSSETFVSSSSPVLLHDIEGLSTWLQEGSPVNHSAQPADNSEPMTPAICGHRPGNVFASYDQNMHCWKTFQRSLIADISNEYLETWPKWGWMQDGVCSRLAPLVHHTHDSGCSSWPTPTATEALGGTSAAMAQRALNGEKRASGANISLKVGDLLKLKYGMPKKPTFYEYLMGIPIGATGLQPVAMGRFHLWLQQHGICCTDN